MKQLKNNDIEMPMDEAFFDALHDKIMAGIEETAIAPKQWHHGPRKYLRAHWRGYLYSGVSMAIFMVALIGLSRIAGVEGSHSAQVAKNEDSIIEASLENTEEFSRLLAAGQSDSEFFMDIAQTSFDDRSVDGLKQTFSVE